MYHSTLSCLSMDFHERIEQAKRQELLTKSEHIARQRQARIEHEAQAAEERDQARSQLQYIWLAVTHAVVSANPDPDVIVCTAAGMRAASEASRLERSWWHKWRDSTPTDAELARMKERELRAVDLNSQPAWDMMHEISVADYGYEGACVFNSREMFLGRDGTIYTDLGRRDGIWTTGGVQWPYGHIIFEPGHDFAIQRPGWHYPDGYATKCHESIEEGLARMVARHSLTLHLPTQ